jgi:hypothetical protein
MLSPRSALHADKLQGVRAPIARSKNMEELDELRQAIEAGDYDQALAILDELDAISRDDKITKMMSYMRVLLVHLIKQVAEQRSTRSWEDSITESLDRTVILNKRRKAGGYYLDDATRLPRPFWRKANPFRELFASMLSLVATINFIYS